MRKKLIVLGFALAAAAASTLTTASADPICPSSGDRVVFCTTHSGYICCPLTAICAC
ncbi:MAG TPA: hypothetical protein VGG20_02865 [Thermoanaerobaculia bacterium]|jgi:hypothetical protein